MECDIIESLKFLQQQLEELKIFVKNDDFNHNCM